MFNLSYTTPSEPKGTIRMSRQIRQLGPATDVNGQTWDVRAVSGNFVSAVPMQELHPYYTDTSGNSYGLVMQTWDVYRVVVEE